MRLSVTLWDAPFRRPLRIVDLSGLGGEVLQVLIQLGLDSGETIEKVHRAPLRDPISFRVGEQLFTLRSEVCRKIQVEAL